MDFAEFKKCVMKAYVDGVVNSSVNGLKFVNAENYFKELYGDGFCMPEGINSVEEHEEYKKVIAIDIFKN